MKSRKSFIFNDLRMKIISRYISRDISMISFEIHIFFSSRVTRARVYFACARAHVISRVVRYARELTRRARLFRANLNARRELTWAGLGAL